MEKRERLERTLAGEAADRAPIAVWRPFPGDDLRSADYAQAIVDFQLRYDWDMCMIAPPWSFAGGDYGLQEEWRGAPDGERIAVRRPIRRSLDWTDLRPADPSKGELGRLTETIAGVIDGLRMTGVSVVVGVLSPLTQAERLVGRELLIRHLRLRPDRLMTGLNTLTESTVRFLDSLRGTAVSGIALVSELADCTVLSEPEYESFGLPGDSALLSSAPKGVWLRIAYLAGAAAMTRLFARLPATLVAWDDRSSETDLAAGRSMWSGPILGGLDAELDMRAGTPSGVREAVRASLHTMGNRRLVVGCGRPLPVTVPHGNLKAARTAVERGTP
ncbi:MAG: hypothetical protein IPM16_02545 [Chloroflexi bacterium]|nr:hypothetical protein [Chloroflexota bacterium]